MMLQHPTGPDFYYGDEIGMLDLPYLGPRGCMVWDETRWDRSLLEFHRRLVALRRESGVLQRGGFQMLPVVDRSGLLWIGTWTQGLFTYAPWRRKFQSSTPSGGDLGALSGKFVSSVLEEPNGTLWVGTMGDALFSLTRGTRTFRRVHPIRGDTRSLSPYDITCLCLRRNGDLWIGSVDGGISILKPQSRAFVRMLHRPVTGKDPPAHMLFVRDKFPAVYERTYKFLNVLDYLNLRLTGRFAATFDSILTSWVTDNRNPNDIRYHDALIRTSGIDAGKFPEIVSCTTVLGNVKPEVAEALGLSADVKVVAGAIDNTAAAIGSGAVDDFMPHLYLGTSSWIAAHVPYKKTDISSSLASVPCALPGRYLLTLHQVVGQRGDNEVESGRSCGDSHLAQLLQEATAVVIMVSK